MSKRLTISLLLIVTIANAKEETALPWSKRHAEGWAWYHDYQTIKPEEPEQHKQPQDPIMGLAAAKEELERALAKAMLNPTQENVLAYMILQHKWTRQAQDFAQLWQKNLLAHPEVYSMMPTTQYGTRIRKEVDAKTRKKLIQNLASNNTLLFFYEGGNAFSQAFSKVVKEFSKQYNFAIKSVAIDGVALKDFPLPIRDQTIAQEMNVNIFPALFLVNMKSLTATPLAFGTATISQIEENITMQFEE